MALEAARQTFASDPIIRPLQLSDIRFQNGLSLDILTGPDASIEIQLIAKLLEDDSDVYSFEIFSHAGSSDGVRDWRLHCSGKFDQHNSTPGATPIALEQLGTATPHNAETVNDDHHDQILTKIETSRQGLTGDYHQTLDPSEDYLIDPIVLDAILSLPPAANAGRNLPATYCVRYISSFTISSLVKSSEPGRFAIAIDTNSSTSYSVQADIKITQGQENAVIKAVLHQACHTRLQEPTMKSLYFKSRSLPDITRLEAPGTTINFTRCVELLTHRWPMCKIKLMDIDSSTTLDDVLDAFQVYSKDQKPLVRSIYLQGTPCPQQSNRVQHLDHTSTKTAPKYHFILAQRNPNLQTVNAELLPRSLACFTTVDKTDQILLREYFEHVYNIDISQGEQWQLWRKKPADSVIHPDVKKILFGALPSGPSLDAVGPFHESIPLEPGAVANFCHNPQNGRFHAVIIDSPDKSITIWSGQDLLPWLQTLLKYADSIMWVSKNTGSPFQKMAGTLLRTLQAEQPALKVCWFLWSDESQKKHSGKSFENEFVKAQESMLEGQNELVLDFTGADAPHIMRYFPDDEVSCSTGIISPRKVTGPLDHAEYELTFAAPQEPVILSKPMKSFDDSGMDQLNQEVDQSACHANDVESDPQDLVEVTIEASVIDLNDVRIFDGCTDSGKTSVQPKFFAGIVKHDPKGCYEPGVPVVGWSNKGHKNRLQVQRSALYERVLKQPAGEAASKFAAAAVAVHIFHEVARARQDETFDLLVTGPLHAALSALCKHNGNTVTSRGSGQKADFVVSYDALKGIQVNSKAIDMVKYLSSPRHDLDAWYSIAPLSCPYIPLGISDYSKAFSRDRKTRKEPFSTVVDHTIHSDPIEHVPIYQPQANLFSSTANYILIGGLGGLGRFICTWMVEHGARQLTVISRSGLTSAEAQSTHAAITNTGSKLDVFAADACDRPTVRSILSSIRKKGPIKGIINLAMILGDAPMASMTGEEWDRALRVKIDSSWILHEETLDDDLDHFILFSSIASVCGNRNQGNYNVANTFLNALAEYRQGMGRCGVSIALGAMSEFLSFYLLVLCSVFMRTNRDLGRLACRHLNESFASKRSRSS